LRSHASLHVPSENDGFHAVAKGKAMDGFVFGRQKQEALPPGLKKQQLREPVCKNFLQPIITP